MQRSEMNPARWKEIERLYYASVELAGDRRSRFLAEACADEEVRQQVASLLANRDKGLSFIERPALDVTAEIVSRSHLEEFVGRTLGHYQVTALIGAGGMGVVYRARDSRLDRDVALKILPDGLGTESSHLSRIEQEAKLLASLNHPNIAAIHDFEESDGIRCLVLEFIEGETLAHRLKRGRIPLEECLTICRQIAEALEAAHERGIVHRDLKPSNVMITPNGSVKVLDFGIAGMLSATVSEGSPVAVKSVTASVALGTPSYASPEQVSGAVVDKRTDTWAFGCVLYEVLTGTKAFEKDSMPDTLAAVIEQEPDWSALPRSTPPKVADLVRRCLQKKPHWRLRDVGDARIELVEQSKSQNYGAIVERRPPTMRWLWVSAAVAVALIAVALTQWPVRPVPSVPEVYLEVTTPPTADPVSLAISPDAQKLVFVATHQGRSRLWLRSLDSPSSRPLERTDHASCPFWSPDSGAVGFFADGWLKRVDIQSGAVVDLADALSCGGTWNRDGTILYSSPLFGPISSISTSNRGPAVGTRAVVTRPERPRQRSHRFPQFLPDHRHFLYYVGGSPDSRGVYVGDLGEAEPRRLLDADTAAVYTSGHLLFVRQGALMAQAFDPKTLTLLGDPFQVAEHVAFDPTRYAAAVSASSNGVIVYRAGSITGQRQFVWVDRTGRELERVGDPDSAGSLDPSLSPDERRAAFYRTVNGQPDIWLLDTRRGVLGRLTSGGAVRPIWSPDGSEMVYASGVPTNLFRRPVAGQADERAILETSQPKGATDWSKDGRFILYRSFDPQSTWDVWALPLDGTRNSMPVARTRFDERDGQFSPDSKWIAYQSNESGRFEIYVQPFLQPGAKATISRDGGAQVRWTTDGRELFYVAFDNRLMAVPVQPTADGQTMEVGAPMPLFTTRIGGAVQGPNRQQYMVSSDGQRFLMNTIVEEETSPIVVLMNWKAKR